METITNTKTMQDRTRAYGLITISIDNTCGQVLFANKNIMAFSFPSDLPKNSQVRMELFSPFLSKGLQGDIVIVSGREVKPKIWFISAQYVGVKSNDFSTISKLFLDNLSQYFHEIIKDKNLSSSVVSFFTDDLISYINFLSDIETYTNSLDIKLLEDISHQHATMTDALLKKADEIEHQTTETNVIGKIKELFRYLTGTWAYQSKFVQRGYAKPYGYPGDFLMMEMIYDQVCDTRFNVGSCFDRYFVVSPYAEAVRNRLAMMENILLRFITNYSHDNVRILNIACGSFRELINLADSDASISNKKLHWQLVDHDPKALAFIDGLEKHCPASWRLEKLCIDVVKLARKQKTEQFAPNTVDVVYSIGLADYLPDRILICLIKFCFNVLKPGGLFCITIKDKSKDSFAPLSPDWFCDWQFVPRTKIDFETVLTKAALENFTLTYEWEASGRIFFAKITKK